jgi:acyl-coenzyme A thioesterase PaaI-like protein
MASLSASPGERVLSLWRRLTPLPFGRQMFMIAFARQVPYSGALGARVTRLEPGFVSLSLDDRRAVRNHLNSVHAIALANLGEMASGLAMTTALPGRVRSIVTGLSVQYEKKARGRLTAESRVIVPEVHGDTDHEVVAAIRDAAGDTVATVRVRWRLSPAVPL